MPFADLELAKTIFEKAVKKYGTKMNHRQVDSLIKRSEFRDQVERSTRKRLKSMVYNYERNGYDAAKAIKLEVVKVECSQLARNHYNNTLLCKVVCAFIRMLIERGRLDPGASFKSFGSGVNTTLNRMIEGAISASHHSQLEEFVQIERSLETEDCETLNSEPNLVSDSKPPLNRNNASLSRLQKKAQADLKKLSMDSNQQNCGFRSPSVQDLQGEFQAFCEGNAHIDS